MGILLTTPEDNRCAGFQNPAVKNHTDQGTPSCPPSVWTASRLVGADFLPFTGPFTGKRHQQNTGQHVAMTQVGPRRVAREIPPWVI